MTPDQKILAAAMESARRIGRRLGDSAAALGPGPLAPDAFENADSETQMMLDAFVKRFEQFSDTVTRQVFRAALVVSGRSVRKMSYRDALNDLEALDLLRDGAFWMDIVSVRNRLAHSYPLDADKQAAALNPALAQAPRLLEEYERFGRAVAARHLLEPL